MTTSTTTKIITTIVMGVLTIQLKYLGFYLGLRRNAKCPHEKEGTTLVRRSLSLTRNGINITLITLIH